MRLVRKTLTIWIFGVVLSGSTPCLAQDAGMAGHFDYDRTAPLNVKQIGVQRRANATIYDITYDSPKGGVVPAYLVVPKGRGPFAAVIWGHWYWANSSMRNRRSFSGSDRVGVYPGGVAAH
jgi:hypothetical protein